MEINFDKPKRWKADIQASVDLYNDWFLKFAPATFRDERKKACAKICMQMKTTGLSNKY